jgi:transcriptional regulator with XRE-family HTH domain
MFKRIHAIHAQGATVPSIALRNANYRNLRADNDIRSDAEFARRAGITPGQLWRVLKGRSEPGNHFIAGTLDVFGVEAFPALFVVLPDVGDGGDV